MLVMYLILRVMLMRVLGGMSAELTVLCSQIEGRSPILDLIVIGGGGGRGGAMKYRNLFSILYTLITPFAESL